MAQMSFETRMADLERMQGPPDAVLQEAAKIVGIDLDKTIHQSFVRPLYKTQPGSRAFKEQWILRWLLKKLGVSDSKSKSANGNSNPQQSFIETARFWSLLLSLTCSIPNDACLEILLERHFYAALAEFIRGVLHNHDGAPTVSNASTLAEHEGPLTKKRRLSPPALQQGDNEAGGDVLLWTALQAACRCVDLFDTPSSEAPTPRRCASEWTGSPKTKANLLGSLLEATTSLLKISPHVEEGDLVAGMLNTLLAFWNDDTSTATDDERQQAFASHCVQPSLSLLDLLATKHTGQKPLVSSRNALERLFAVHIIFPLRTTFNEQFTKKWKSTADVVLYEQMETLLQAYSRLLQPADGDFVHSHAVAGSPIQKLCWILLSVAAQSIPFSDVRRRHQEQQYLDSLFIWLVHVTWSQIPHITSTGVLRQQFAKHQDAWVSPLKDLLDVAHSRKLRFSHPIVSYILQAVLATNAPLAPWTLLVKVIQLDLDILIPVFDSSDSKDFLGQLMARIESTTVSKTEYDLLRNDFILPLMRKFSQSRALGAFIDAWRHGLAEAIRTRYISKHGKYDIPTVLVWDDDDMFDELKTLSVIHAPPGMAEQMLKDLVISIRGLEQKIGSTAEEFAKLAIFTAILQVPYPEGGGVRLDYDQLILLLRGATDALRRKADYQGQRWRLRKLARLLIETTASENMPIVLDSMFKPGYSFVSLKDMHELKEADAVRRNAQCLEGLECFYLVIDLAAKSQHFEPNLRAEMDYFVHLAQDNFKRDASLWSGRSSECRNIDDVVGPCIGKLLQRSEVFVIYPDIFEKFVSICLLNVFQVDRQKATSPQLVGLCLTVLSLENVAQSPELRDLVLDKIEQMFVSSPKDRKLHRSILESVPLTAVGKLGTKKLATAIHKRLFERTHDQDIGSVASDLDMLLHLDSLFPGTFVDGKHWQDWVKLSQRELELKSAESLFDKSVRRPASLATYLKALQLLERIFQVNWARALEASKHKPSVITEIFSGMDDSSRKLELFGEDHVPFSCLQIFLAVSLNTVNDPNQIRMLNNIRHNLRLKLGRNLKQALDDKPGPANLLKLQLILQAAHSVHGPGRNEELCAVISSIQKKLEVSNYFPDADGWDDGKRIWLRVQRLCLPFVSTLDEGQRTARTAKLESQFQQLILFNTLQCDWSNGDIARLATEAELFTSQLEPKDWWSILRTTREKSKELNHQPACAFIQASILSRVEQRPQVLHPTLAQELGRIARFENANQMSVIGLLLALENCKAVLEIHPLVVNQWVLDGLLAAIQAATSSGSDNMPSLKVVESRTLLDASNIYERICAVMGAILSRHRRRLTDRFHLLLPVLQNLLRCLFWPGLKAVEGQKGSAANAIDNFGKTLPRWMHGSPESLSLSSADHFSRLLSSICNPTVSAARSSSKRHNELNDEVKKTRKLASQHMQYIVMEYCRCFLDGQISPAMKDQLIPGMYKVMDAIERDLMRAMNAGMDPSSRAIFKGLFDDYHRYGKWDKS